MMQCLQQLAATINAALKKKQRLETWQVQGFRTASLSIKHSGSLQSGRAAFPRRRQQDLQTPGPLEL
jgi:hypothetical protein